MKYTTRNSDDQKITLSDLCGIHHLVISSHFEDLPDPMLRKVLTLCTQIHERPNGFPPEVYTYFLIEDKRYGTTWIEPDIIKAISIYNSLT